MSFAVFCSFLSYALIAAITPGPNNILALGSAAAHGLRRSAPLLAGMCAGFLAVMLLCACAVPALERVVPEPADRLAWPGAIYILWLARQLAAQGYADTGNAEGRDKTGGNCGARPLGFWSGFALQFVNGKILLCGLTGLSVFVLPHAPRESVAAHALGCALAFAGLGIACNLLWAAAGGLLSGLFQRHGRAVNLVLAGVLAYSGVRMLI